jgi:tRNA modification GTPase
VIRHDTIVAISSPVQPCGRIILRLSGEAAHALAQEVCDAPVAPRGVHRAMALFAGLRVPASFYTFARGASYTSEDVAEIHLPGSPLLADLLLRELLSRGARLAEPGEFTARAFFAGRLDLARAEGVAAAIAAGSERELRAARRLCEGELTRRLRPLTDELAAVLALVEAGIDFAEEEITVLTPAELAQRADGIRQGLQTLLAESMRFERLSHEPVIVLVGRPNAGKSTLFNALCGQERVVVSSAAGTTRDAVAAHAQLARGRVKIVDTAGAVSHLHNGMPGAKAASHPPAPSHPPPEADIELQMQQQAHRAAAGADAVVWVRERGDNQPLHLPSRPHLLVESKADLPGPPTPGAIAVSVHTGAGLPQLRHELDVLAFGAGSGGQTLALNARHVSLIERARAALQRVAAEASDELNAFELREALDALGEVTGAVAPDDVLGRIFSSFCIGK